MKYIKNSSEVFSNDLGVKLHQYNRENCDYIYKNSDDDNNYKETMNIALYDKNKLVGGLSGWFQMGWYYLDQIWIQNDYRKLGIGSKLIKRIEKESKKRKCIGIRTETWDFQAKGFYEKCGFEAYSELKDYPPGATEYYLKKVF